MQTLIVFGSRYNEVYIKFPMSYWSEHTQYYLHQFEIIMKELNKEQ